MTHTIILRKDTVKARSGFGGSTIYQRMSDGTFPAAVPLGPNSVGWVEAEVEAILKAIIGGASDDELRALVSEMHAARGYRPDEAKKAKYKAIVAKRRATLKKRQEKAATGAQAA